MKKYLLNILQIIILIIWIFNFLLIVFFWDFFSNLINKLSILSIFWLIFIVETIIILYLINIFYEKPILELKLAIINFLNWKYKKEKKIKIKESKNKNINYIILFFNMALNALKNIKEEFVHWKEIKWEVELAKEIQWKTFTKKLKEIPSLRVIAKSKPAWEIWWDSYDIIQSWDNYYIYVWDATWHWVWAWFIMMMVNALISAFSKVYEKWSDILIKTNEILKPRVKANLLMTVLLLRWNQKEKKMYFTWAWHEYLMIYKHKQKKCFKVKSGWIALWMIKDSSKVIKEKRINFEPHDIIVLYSDWITEAINKPKRDWTEIMFWEDRLVEAIEKAPNLKWENFKTAWSVFNNITISLSKFMWYNHIQLDDITLVVVEYKWSNNYKDYSTEIPKEFITEWNWN